MADDYLCEKCGHDGEDHVGYNPDGFLVLHREECTIKGCPCDWFVCALRGQGR